MIRNHKHLIYLLVLSVIQVIYATDCIVENETICLFVNVITDKTNPLFEPNAENPDNIKKVYFSESIVYELTPEICMKFKNLEEFDVSGVSLQELSIDALNNCKKLKSMKLENNNLKNFDENMFETNQNLVELSFASNFLKKIDLFEFKEIKSLKSFNIENNQITDLDIKQILIKFSLDKIYINKNEFDCNRLKVIIAALARNNIEIVVGYKPDPTVEQVDEIQCISEATRIKKQIEQNSTNIEDLKKEIEKLDADLKELKEQQVVLNDTLGEISQNLTTFVDGLDNMNETIGNHSAQLYSINQNISIIDNNATMLERMVTKHGNRINSLEYKFPELDKVLEIIQQNNSNHQKELENLKNTLLAKTDRTTKIYYTSIGLIIVICVIVVIVLVTIINLFCCKRYKDKRKVK